MWSKLRLTAVTLRISFLASDVSVMLSSRRESSLGSRSTKKLCVPSLWEQNMMRVPAVVLMIAETPAAGPPQTV